MRTKWGWGLVWGAIVVSCVAGQSRKAAAGNCALYARAVTGVDLYSAAGGWWYEAAGRYQRGQMPAVGSILVFRPTRASPSGHVAVVSKVVGPSMVLVDQSNWYHGRVTLGTPVADTSPNHDWTTVAVMNLDSGQFGRDNPAFGFIYPQAGSGGAIAGLATAGYEPSNGTARFGGAADQQLGLFHFAVAENYSYRSSRHQAHRRHARHSGRLAGIAHRHGREAAPPHSHARRATHPPRIRTVEPSRHDHSERVASAG